MLSPNSKSHKKFGNGGVELYDDSPLDIDPNGLDDLDTSISKMIYEKIFSTKKRAGDMY